MPTKRIVISGYYGFGNTGDEAVLAGILATFREPGIDAEVTVLSANPTRTLTEHPGVNSVHRYRIRDLIRVIRQADLVISGGGSLLQDVTSAMSPRYYLFVLQLARLLRRKTMVYAQGVGPLVRESTRRAVSRVLNKVNAITVRDADSKALLESIGVNRVPITVTADPAFLVEPDLAAADAILSANGLGDGDLIGVSLRPWPTPASWLDAASKGVAMAADELGTKVALIPMYEPDDLAALEAVGAGALLANPGGVEVAKALISRCSLVVGMRLHALIFAAAEGVPFVPVVYDPKVASFADIAGQPGGVSVEDMTAEALRDGILQAWQDRVGLAGVLKERAQRLRDAALESGRVVQRLLG